MAADYALKTTSTASYQYANSILSKYQFMRGDLPLQKL